MKIAVIGTGNVGGALGSGWAQHGHEVIFGSRQPESEKVGALVAQAGGAAASASPRGAARDCDVVVLATPWSAIRETVDSLGDVAGKILVDCTNPLKPDLSGLEVEGKNSGGELVASWAPGARVVKAFNTTGANNMADSRYGDAHLAMFVCGDDAEAKRIVTGLAEELGFEAIDAGSLARSRELEHLAVLWIALAYQQGLGLEFGFSLARRGDQPG